MQNTECVMRSEDPLPRERSGLSSVRLQIKRLVLDGIPMDGHNTALLKAAGEAELTAHLAQHGLASPSPRAEAIVAGSEIRLPPAATTRQPGEQIGRSIYAAFSPPD